MHMRQNKKDYSSKRGLEAVLAQRKKLMKYLYKTNRYADAPGDRAAGGSACFRVQARLIRQEQESSLFCGKSSRGKWGGFRWGLALLQ